MGKTIWQPGNMLYPAPAVMVSCGDNPSNYNIITIAWAGNICSEPAMTSISIRPIRHSFSLIERTREFVINLTTEQLAFATDFCGVKSGKEINKWERLKLTPKKGVFVAAPLIEQSPVNIECKVTQIIPLGSHHMFLAEVKAIHADKKYFNRQGAFDLKTAKPICYSHGKYYSLTKQIGYFGYSITKKKRRKKRK
jgi:flavin reductase (DIM6/NTAB) family NADH-FMN oxidoreductase RutF